MTDRVQPHDEEAERAVLGAMLYNPAALDPAFDVLEATDFYRPNHQHIFDAAASLTARGEPVDATTVHAALIDAKVTTISHADLLSLVASNHYTSSNIRKYVQNVRHRALLRTIIRIGSEVSGLGWEASEQPGDQLIDRAEALVHELGSTRRVEQRLARIDTIVDIWADTLDERQSHQGMSGVSTGWAPLDGYLAGMKPGQFLTVAARPGMGKSLFGGCLALNVAAAGTPVLFVSAEMSREELMDRFMAQSARVPMDFIRKGSVTVEHWKKIHGAVTAVKELPLYVEDQATSTLFTIRSAARRVATNEGGLGLIVVDYLQLLTPGKRNENRQVEVAELSRGLKKTAMDLKVPVVALAQLNRNLEMRADRTPVLSDLRESGAIENDSDVVMFLYRDDVYKPDSSRRGQCDVVIAKQRNGPTGTVTLTLDIGTGRFTSGVGAF